MSSAPQSSEGAVLRVAVLRGHWVLQFNLHTVGCVFWVTQSPLGEAEEERVWAVLGKLTRSPAQRQIGG